MLDDSEPSETDDADDGGVWMSLAAIARAKGVSRQTVCERADRLERDGKIVSRRKGRARLVNLAQYDQAVGETTNLAREQAVRTRRAKGDTAPASNSSYSDQQTRRMRYEADLKELELAQRRGELVAVADVVAAAELLGQTQVEILEAGVRRAANAEERAMLKRFVYAARARLAEAMNEFAGGVTRQPNERTDGLTDVQEGEANEPE